LLEVSAMPPSQRAEVLNLDAYAAVFTILSKHRPGAVVSTHYSVVEARRLAPRCEASDDELVNLIAKVAITHKMAISFDHGRNDTGRAPSAETPVGTSSASPVEA
jgi:hypothetical protein